MPYLKKYSNFEPALYNISHIASMDYELVKKLQKGDVGAFDKLFRKYAGKLYAFSLKYLRSKEDAEGLVQNVFLKVWDKRKEIRTDTSFRSFLFTIAYNEMCNFFRKRSNAPRSNENIENLSLIADLNIEETLDYKIILKKVEHLISKLPEKQRIVFNKSRKEGLSSKEIAKELDMSPKTVDNYISIVAKYIKENINSKMLLINLFLFLSS